MTLKGIIQSIIIILLNLLGFLAISQEQLQPLHYNLNLPEIKQSSISNKKTTNVPSLNLPFFDDFSYAYKSSYPSVYNWLDSNVYVNSSFAIAPLTLGVATFDGLNKKGYPYSISAPVNYSGLADILTSRPINLQSTATRTYSPTDSIHLSFYYQAEGNGEAPELNDSLSVDFWKPRQQKWTKVWGVKGYNPSAADTNFYRVRIPITDTAFYHYSFQFRFRNNATTSGSLDHWHVDYVQIKEFYFYEDTVLDDIAFAYKPSSFLKNYSTMPYRQYNRDLEMGSGFRNFFRNNFDIPKFSVYNYTIKDALDNNIPTDVYGTFNNPGFLPFLNNGYYDGLASNPIFKLLPFPTSFSDSTFFKIQHTLVSSGDSKNANDTLVHIQKFSNYYAYDDGSAELGYYLNAYGAKVGLRFTVNTADTLRSVRVYFDPVVEGPAIKASSFRLMIWASINGGPGNLLYKDSLMYPTYLSEGHHSMPTYKLSSCLPLTVGTYYIGIQQTTNQPLNIGFDKNTNHSNALYYNLGDGWVQSAIKGSLMINPVMGCTYPEAVSIVERQVNDDFSVIPNPAQNSITINGSGQQLNASKIEILTALGQIIHTQPLVWNEPIDISSLPNGLYLIQVKGHHLNMVPKKIIISK